VSTGTVYCGAGINRSGVGTVAWSAAGNIAGSTTETFAKAGNLKTGVLSNYLQASSYDFSGIPNDATIKGITVGIRRKASHTPGIVDHVVSLVKAGVVTGQNKAQAAEWPIVAGESNYGGAADLWLSTWTPADLKRADFGVVLSVSGTFSGNRDALVDYISVTVEYTVATTTYTLTSSAGANGTIAPLGATLVASGGSQIFTITPAEHYHVGTLLVDGGPVTPATSYTFTNVTAAHTIAASFAIDMHSVTYTAGAGGTISGQASQTVAYGSTSSAVTADPDPGHHFVRWSDGQESPTRSDPITGDFALSAEFAIDTFTITTSPGANGSISPASPVVNWGDDVALTITADPGYHTADFVVDGVSQGPIGAYSFFDVYEDHTVSATFAADAVITHTLTYSAGANGSITGAASQTVPDGGGGSQVTAVPNPGYHFVSWSDGVLTASRTDANVTADITASAEFAVNSPPIVSTDASSWWSLALVPLLGFGALALTRRRASR